jgi:hypothetical protein
MHKFLIVILVIQLSCQHKIYNPLVSGYYFVSPYGGLNKLIQSNDTLYDLKCNPLDSCNYLRPWAKRFRIISFEKLEEYFILKTERLDSIALTTDPYPQTRFSIDVIRIIDDGHLGYRPLKIGLTKTQLDSFRTDSKILNNLYYLTYFSRKTVLNFKNLKSIKTQNDLNEISKKMDTPENIKLMELIMQNKKDFYTFAGIDSDILIKTCLELGFNPLTLISAARKYEVEY